MKNSLIESMMAADKNQRKMPARKNKVEFLALKEDISEALEKGWPMTAIWETLRDEGSFTASYNTFRLYILEYLNGQKPGYSQKDSLAPKLQKPIKKHSVKKSNANKEIKGFTYNPIPNIEELL
ncbi:TPA: TraK family protein [Legionella pneumophila]|nr:conjugal transfer protein TraK [Legionella pneumophila subsp. pneumophila]HAU1836042.1 conjugal transfer protein TraK [Legionella pneumophila]HBD9286767.1 TraK family protein [Legionella pneumophila]HDY2618858.1 TraK family protein [Legionella pneumophila]